jgi:hypothetical protein
LDPRVLGPKALGALTGSLAQPIPLDPRLAFSGLFPQDQDSLSSNTLSSFLLSRKDQPSFFDDFSYYNSSLNEYVSSFGERFIGLVLGDEDILRSI